MKVILYNAVSLDGFIATESGGTDWVDDIEEWEAAIRGVGCMIVGRKTHEEVGVIKSVKSFIYTNRAEKFTSTGQEIFISGSPDVVLMSIQIAGFEEVILAGGAETNASFAQTGFIDEMILDVHPLLLGKGKKLLGEYSQSLNLELISSGTNPKGFVQNHYKVNR